MGSVVVEGAELPTVLGRRYDAFLWFEETSALHPLHAFETGGGQPETWPFGV